MKHGLAHKSKGQLGASMVEYALLVALVALIAIPAVSGLGKSVNSKYETATREVAGAGTIVTCNAQHPDWPDC